MFQILVCQMNALMLEQCQGKAPTSVLVTGINSRRCYVLGKPIFVFINQASTTMLKSLFLMLQTKPNKGKPFSSQENIMPLFCGVSDQTDGLFCFKCV